MPPPKYKLCKTCGNRNHPASGQCRWCGSRLRRPMDSFYAAGMGLILLALVVWTACSMRQRSPAESKRALPRASQSAE